MGPNKGVAGKWRMKYFLEYAVVLTIYLAATAICVPRALEMSSRSGRALMLLAPCIGILLMSAAVIRHFLRIDEYLRAAIVEYFAVAGALTFVCALGYGFFELVGFPRVSAWWALPVMSSGMLLWRLFRVFCKR